MSTQYKVVLVFNLKAGAADEELRRSSEPTSFPSRLATQPGFLSLELVRVSEERTLSIQTWESEASWWRALEAVKAAEGQSERESLLVSREFYGGPVMARRGAVVS